MNTKPEELHAYGRAYAAALRNPPRKKLLRWNDIVDVVLRFYPTDPKAGVRECVDSCCLDQIAMYDGDNTLAVSLAKNYGWMFPERNAL